MFGFVMTNPKALSLEEQTRYEGMYCGVCRSIGKRCSKSCTVGISYDMAFLHMLLASLYEPAEDQAVKRCALHPVHGRHTVTSKVTEYCADMNVALAYYNCLDKWQDDRKLAGLAGSKVFGRHWKEISHRWPRQCSAIADCITQLSACEAENCPNPDLPANCFGHLMGELLVYQEDLWAPHLREMGMGLGRFIYLADAAVDYEKDLKRGSYNPWAAMGSQLDPESWKVHLTMAMARCTDAYEMLPLVQDKSILDRILYDGVWTIYRQKRERKNLEEDND